MRQYYEKYIRKIKDPVQGTWYFFFVKQFQ